MRSFSVIITACVALTACGTPQERARAYMTQGDAYAASGRSDAAIVEYRNVIKQTPDVADAYRKLGDAYVAAGNSDEAFRAFARASALDPDDVHSPLASVRLLLAAGNNAEAHARAEAMLERRPDDVEAQTLVGITFARLQRLAEAEVQLTAAGARDTSGEALTALGDVKQASDDAPGAEAAFRGAVRTAPDSSAARVALAQFLWSTGRLADAERELKEACARGGDAELASRALATFYLGTGRSREAEPYLTQAAHRPAQKYHSTLALADFYAAEQRYAEARATLAPIAHSAIDGPAARIRQIAIAFDTGSRDEARRALDAAIQKGATAEALALKARFLAADGQPADALQAARDALDLDPHLAAAQYLAGLLALEQRQFSEAEGDFRAMLSDNRWAASAKMQLARVKLAGHRPDEAVQLAAAASDGLPGALEPQLVLAQAWIASGDTARGRAELQRLADAFPQSVQPSIALASLDLGTGDRSRARARIDAGLSIDAGNPDLLALSASAALAAGNDGEAARSAARAAAAAPSSFDAHLVLAQVYAKQGDLERARRVFEAFAAAQPGSSQARTAVGVMLQTQGKDEEARAWYTQALALDPKDSIAARNLAGIMIADGSDADAAVRLAQTAVEERPDDARAHGVLGWTLFKSGRPGLAASELTRAGVLDPREPLYRQQLIEVRRALAAEQ